jgi:hypothetical protein
MYQGSYMLNAADCPMAGQQLMMPKAQTLTDDSLGVVTEDLLQVNLLHKLAVAVFDNATSLERHPLTRA